MKSRMLSLFAALLVAGVVMAQDAPTATEALTLEVLGTFQNGGFDEGASEITAYHAGTQTLYVVNGESGAIDMLSIADPTNITLNGSIDLAQLGEGANSVAVYGDIVAVAIESDPKTDPGFVGFFTPAGEYLNDVEVGALPDMITFTPDGTKALTANEGEPDDDYAVDPEGSVSIIDLSGGVEAATVTTLGFADFNADGSRAAELPADVRIYGPGATVAMDLEPEYIAVTADGATAFVTLQEANAVAVIDIAAGTITEIRALGFKDHSAEGNALDLSNEDGAINIANWPIFGMYQPDAIDVLTVGDATYYVTANEGDTRDYDGYSEEGEISEITLDETAFPNAAELQAEDQMGKAELTLANGDTDGDGDYDALYLPGARSFSVWSAADGALVYDSGDDFEQITAAVYPDDFNITNDENNAFDDRSDNKGPEPEAIELGTVGGVTYAFIGLERIVCIMVYDMTDPTAPVFVTYVNNRDFSGDAEAGTAGDLGPEGVLFIPAADSPTGADLLVVSNEISGTTTVFAITQAQ